jgi:hypothetical protein
MLDCFVKTVRHEGWSALFKVGPASSASVADDVLRTPLL